MFIDMVTVVFTIGTANILLGYALAYYLRMLQDAEAEAEPSPIPEPVHAVDQPPQPEPEPEPEPEEEDLLADIDVPEEIPKKLVDRLEAEAIEARSLVEATAQVMRLEIGKYREAMVRLEEEMRQPGITAARLKSVIDRTVKLNHQWLAIQADASGNLNERVDSLGEFSELGQWLDKVLLDQQSQIESTCNNLALLDVGADVLGAGKLLASEFSRLLDLSHNLRDGVGDALLTTLRADNRTDQIEAPLRRDGVTGFANRAGFEIAMAGWWKADQGRQRLASAMLLDISHTGRFNRQHGMRFGDQLIAAAGSLLDETLRKDRGFEIVARINGQQFLLFFGDTGPRNASSAAERMRQSFADATFESGSNELDVTVTCAVTELASTDDVPSLVKRLTATLAAAKQSGRNCTMLDEGDGPQPVAPPDYQIPSRVITIEDT